ncbi:MAG: electron transfer flavoprotein subunit beta/FixA family protein [Bacteroidales bacterium]|nr:electron transfer flavoprotein subunit beta/FixA family protein [Bacteroidales bacterium]
MKLLVCISNVPDTTTKIKLSPDGKSIDLNGIQWVINPWDELALTRALELKELAGSGIEKVSVAIVGSAEVEPTLRKALAIGADDAIRIDVNPLDAFQVASELSSFLQGNPYELVLCGIESSDYNGSMVGGMLAELMGVPSVSSVSALNIQGSTVLLSREIDGGKESISINTPMVAIIQKGIAIDPRIPSMRGIMTARTKPLTVVPSNGSSSLTKVVTNSLPVPKASCHKVDADNVSELVRLLHEEAKVI